MFCAHECNNGHSIPFIVCVWLFFLLPTLFQSRTNPYSILSSATFQLVHTKLYRWPAKPRDANSDIFKRALSTNSVFPKKRSPDGFELTCNRFISTFLSFWPFDWWGWGWGSRGSSWRWILKGQVEEVDRVDGILVSICKWPCPASHVHWKNIYKSDLSTF